jgi:hypothetical protein
MLLKNTKGDCYARTQQEKIRIYEFLLTVHLCSCNIFNKFDPCHKLLRHEANAEDSILEHFSGECSVKKFSQIKTIISLITFSQFELKSKHKI